MNGTVNFPGSFPDGFDEPGNYYEVLDISRSASPSEVRDAYLRAKSAYNKDSVAVYSLINPGDREKILHRIEEAYEILSNSEKRRNYDSHHGIVETTGTIDNSNVVSIDRVPPMETIGGEEDLLVAPTTDFVEVTQNPTPQSVTRAVADAFVDMAKPKSTGMSADIEQEIRGEIQWPGGFIRRVRESQNVSIEELSNITKISKTYLMAIEQEDFKKLPALVFMRGFMVQVCRTLKLPQEKVLEAYLQRFKSAKIGDK